MGAVGLRGIFTDNVNDEGVLLIRGDSFFFQDDIICSTLRHVATYFSRSVFFFFYGFPPLFFLHSDRISETQLS